MEEMRKYFLITERSELKNLTRLRAQLQQFYFFRTMPNTYFDLPPPKQPLPMTPQQLRPRLRKIFPFFPKDNEDFKSHIRMLRQDYSFVHLPNDYLITKKRLPQDPAMLKSTDKFSFSMQDKEMV